jgi:hypothetical protein
MSLRLSGINPLSYMGVEPYAPPALVIKTRTPTVNDSQNVNVGTLWLITNPQELWYLASLSMNQALWIQLYPAGGGGGGASEFITDAGTANEVAGILNVLGDTRVTTSGAGNTVSLHLSGAVPSVFDTDSGTATPSGGTLVIAGGSNINTSGAGDTVAVNLDNNVSISGNMHVGTDLTVVDTLTLSTDTDGVLQTNGSGLVSATNGTNGQVLIGGGTAPLWANLTSFGETVIITNGPNSINLESTGGGGGAGGTLSFFAYQPTNYNVPPVAAAPGYSQASYSLGSSVSLTNPVNAGGAFYPGDGVGTPASFTAPVRGRYAFSFTSALRQGNDTINSNLIFEAFCAIVAPSFTYLGWTGQNVNALSSFLYSVCTATAVVELNVNDVVTFQTWGPILLTPEPGGAYCYQVLGVTTTSVYPAGDVDYNPTYVQGWLLESF